MRTVALWFLPACLAIGQLANGAPVCGGHGDRDTLLVTTGWLADHLKDPNVVVLGVGQDGDYEKGHIRVAGSTLPPCLSLFTTTKPSRLRCAQGCFVARLGGLLHCCDPFGRGH
jgi:hypothetical protein